MSPENEKKKVETSVWIALIGMVGTLIAALVSSPLVIRWVDQQTGADSTPVVVGTPVPGPQPVQIFNRDFENGSTSGFGFQGGDWVVVKNKTNSVLEAHSSPNAPQEVPWATFGPTDFANGIIDVKVKFEKVGTFYLVFRDQQNANYVFVLAPDQVVLGSGTIGQTTTITPLADTTARVFSTQVGVWYDIRIDARGQQITAYVDGNRLFSATNAALPQGGLQLILQPGTRAAFDNVQVWSYDQ